MEEEEEEEEEDDDDDDLVHQRVFMDLDSTVLLRNVQAFGLFSTF
jgi:hypothetical protein